MNLLGMLLKLMLAKNAVSSVAGKTGLSDKQIKSLMTLAIPLLLKYLTGNASQGSGAQSLLTALSQHTNKNSMDLQLQDADEKDGSLIIGHILGNDRDKVTRDLSSQTGIDPAMVARILTIIAPALLSGISAASSQAAQTPKPQAAQAPKPQAAQAPKPQAAAPSPLGGLLGSLLGFGKEEPDEAIPVVSAGTQNAATDGTALLQLLLGAMK